MGTLLEKKKMFKGSIMFGKRERERREEKRKEMEEGRGWIRKIFAPFEILFPLPFFSFHFSQKNINFKTFLIFFFHFLYHINTFLLLFK
jgi:hypothetical protein